MSALRLALRSSSQRIAGTRFLSSSSSQTVADEKFYPVYVHHLSKVVLEHFQNEHNHWVVNHKLEKGLKMNPDGTFVLRFPCSQGRQESGRIWTSYDGSNKQHWLSCYKDGLLERFLIKDVIEGGEMSDATINANVRQSVDHLIQHFEKRSAT